MIENLNFVVNPSKNEDITNLSCDIVFWIEFRGVISNEIKNRNK